MEALQNNHATALRPVPALTRRVYAFDLLDSGLNGYTEACNYIHRRFARQYDAQINTFMPRIAIMHRDGVIKAAAGLRRADQNTVLFIEHYLDEPIETILINHFGTPDIVRENTAEIGNLAATGPGAIPGLFAHYAAVLEALGIEYLTCNATPQVQAIIQHLGLPFEGLIRAERCRIPDPEQWGRYYDTPSHVMAAPVAGILTALENNYGAALAHARKSGSYQ